MSFKVSTSGEISENTKLAGENVSAGIPFLAITISSLRFTSNDCGRDTGVERLALRRLVRAIACRDCHAG